ncbi:MAG: FIG001590: Putative conserved exported protein precursor [uncultured Lysobacter sp.]|uniref:FIG001590: Putative conserved exported protein n=1 Tax=uncultured Lysobacter sp. TaxID=271060 RepID=A0A6J4KRS5_9GAMM|nr:MAG: FIG001590: Putative conserved exported protein precursor [uncultured Lysobacter sp.]
MPHDELSSKGGLPELRAVEAEIAQLSLATSASELHGALCGWLAGGGANVREWPARILVDDSTATPAAGSALDTLRTVSAAQLADRSFEFDLLLPADDTSLAERSGALFDWCRGFLGSFGLAAGGSPKLSDESSEALTDLAKLAAATPQDDGDEEDEEALVEIEEFVRVATLLLHGDCVLAAQHRQSLN